MVAYYKYFNTDDATDSSNFWGNFSSVYSTQDDFTSSYEAVEDITVDTVLTSIYLNGFLFVVIMLMYEWLRRLLPSVYSSEMKRQFKINGGWKTNEELNDATSEGSSESGFKTDDRNAAQDDDAYLQSNCSSQGSSGISRDSAFDESFMEIPKSGSHSLPEVISLNWVSNVLDVPWDTVRKYAGLDGYFFLRYIRMNLRICSVTCIWAFITLIPIYATGYHNDQQGWYHMSVANLRDKSWRLWIPTIFAYLFSGFVCFVMKQEYRHFLELRMDFLARGTSFINPQHHYSLMVENIPLELRSEKALSDYFESLFPGKVHSTSMVLNLPDLEYVATRCMRVCRRLEKSIAFYHATGKRATHNVGSPRMTILGIDMAPCDGFCFGSAPNLAYVDNRRVTEKPQKGTHVDSISYYTYDLADMTKEMCSLQRRKAEIALEGTNHPEANNWFTKLVVSAYEMADEIMIDSAEDNALRTAYISIGETGVPIPQAELMGEKTIYGTLQGVGGSRSTQSSPYITEQSFDKSGSDTNLLYSVDDATFSSNASIRSKKQEDVLDKARSRRQRKLVTPGERTGILRRWAGRLGLDFVVSGIKFTNRQIDNAVDGVLLGSSMSSTGFVTFLDLTSLTTAASAPLTSKPEALDVCVAPEPKDIIWRNAHISLRSQSRRENHTNIILGVIGLLWIFPLATIQAFARADYIAKIPGMEWILTAGGGSVSQFVNGYLPVAALLALTMILPIIFEFLARNYERRKRLSDVQNSMLGRYFYFQVLNLYVSVTAGTVWKSLADIIDHPTSILSLLGESMPFMVGYFVSLLVTKVLVGLPAVFLRFGALSKMCLRRMLSLPSKLTQRELDEMYSPENVLVSILLH
uniref:CSC1/OSCA1-like cytosolic domain-containing protein n=1 Tax=Pseudo-nitzschia australis TaxID=44445 RepID=A0A7S4AB76_9STRA